MDHSGGEGTNAELFTAAVQSAVFVVSDRDQLVRISPSKIPAECRVSRSINLVLEAYSDGKSWPDAREMVLKDSQDLGWFQAPANLAFVIIGWLYGEGDFGKSLRTAVNCGNDTDCTVATLGINIGRDKIPAEWTEPIGERILKVAIDRGSTRVPCTLSELTDLVNNQISNSLATFGSQVVIGEDPTDLSGVTELDLMD